jgi:hypothetical protein
MTPSSAQIDELGVAIIESLDGIKVAIETPVITSADMEDLVRQLARMAAALERIEIALGKLIR